MKKIFSTLTLLTLITGGILVFVSPVQAATEGVLEGCFVTKPGAWLSGCASGTVEKCPFETNSKCGICCILQTLYSVTDWFFVILVALAGIFVIIGAMNLLTSAGDPAKVKSGRDYIMYAAIGLIVGFLAKAIPAIVKMAVGA